MQRADDRCRLMPSAVVSMLMVCMAAPAILATEADMAQLPIVEPFRCAICHVQDDPSAFSHDLNLFGVDFLANGRTWNAALAALDSDNDGCSNGLELGDLSGDGVSDGNMTELSSNPGRPGDCGELVIDSFTWGALKRWFDRR